MANDSHPTRSEVLNMHMSEFWSGDLGLTLVTISLVVLILVITPLREAGLPGRFFFDIIMVTLMISGALAVNESHIATAAVALCPHRLARHVSQGPRYLEPHSGRGLRLPASRHGLGVCVPVC